MSALLLTIEEAAQLLSISRSHMYEQFISSGRLRVVRIGRSARIVALDLEALVDELASSEGGAS